MEDMMTNHAKKRQNARSFRDKDIAAFHAWADSETIHKGSAFGLSLSEQAAVRAREAGLGIDQISRLRRIYMIVADGQVITLYRRPTPRRDARRNTRLSLRAWGRV
jgi:hypothetical protein